MFSDEFIAKHTAKCEKKLNPYQYSERGKGRPTNKEVEEHAKTTRRKSKATDI
jgi:hypothetical protein